MVEVYRKLLGLLTRQERGRLYILGGMILITGLLEMIGVASIVPFMWAISDPTIIETNAHLARLYDVLGFTDAQTFMVFLGVGVFGLIVFGLLFKALTQYLVYRFTMMRAYSISSRLLHGYLYQPYTWFLHRNSAELGANVLTETNQAVTKSLLPAMQFLTHAVIVAFLTGIIVLAQPVVALSAALVLGGVYALIHFAVSNYISRIGAERREANQQRFQATNEAMGGVKELKLLGLEHFFIRRFQDAARKVAKHDAAIASIAEVPRYILEAIAFGGMVFFVLFLLIGNQGSLLAVIPILALYAFAGVRLFPALQKVYNALAQMRFSKATLDRLHQAVVENEAAARARPPQATEPLRLKERLELVDVHYTYPQAERGALRGLALAIEARSTVGIVGGTGAGKTTAVDLMLGLLAPDRGEIRVDGTPITPANLRAWQRSIGYVPQQIFLTDDTVIANIAFGIPREAVDRAAVERAARIAELHDFVTGELPAGYDTVVGERGLRLSGGQRQRIGIARALYHDPDVLILDEATSALDNLTERAVMDAVHNLGRAKTIVMIAHRLTTVRECEVIFMLEDGRLVAAGRYDELLETSGAFRAMARGVA